MSTSIDTRPVLDIEDEVETVGAGDLASPVTGESTVPERTRRQKWVWWAQVGIVLAAVAIVVPVQIQVVQDRAARDAYEQAIGEHDTAVDSFLATADALTDRYALASEELYTFLTVIGIIPDGVLDPAETKTEYIDAVEEFRDTAGIASSGDDEIVPATYDSTLESAHATPIPDGASREAVQARTAALERATVLYDERAAEAAGITSDIDDAYDAAMVKLDALMRAGQAWGDRDVYEKDTAEQGDALTTAAQALVKPEGEEFADVADRLAAIEAFVAAQAAAKAGHDQAVAAEEEAARQAAAAAEAERRAAEQWSQNNTNNGWNNGGGGGTNNQNNNSSDSGGASPGDGGGMAGGLPWSSK